MTESLHDSIVYNIELNNMRIGVIIAMDIEYQKMCEALGGKPQGRINGNDVILWQCGIGKVNAAIGAMNLISQHHPDCIISTGLAGGIDDCLHVMDVVVGSQTTYHDVWCGEGNAKGQVRDIISERTNMSNKNKHLVSSVEATIRRLIFGFLV